MIPQTEAWMFIAGTEEKYLVSDVGRIKRHKTGKIMSQKITPFGYREVTISLHGKHKTIRCGRTVAMAFLPNPSGLPQVNHIDGNKKNDSISNLEWVTCKQNTIHAFRVLGKHGPRGTKCFQHKLSEENVRDIRSQLAVGNKTQLQIGKEFGVSMIQIGRIHRKLAWKWLS